VLVTLGLLLSAAWDADGNPNTDNLPQIAIVNGASVADLEAPAQESNSSTPRFLTRVFTLFRRHSTSLRIREWLWRSVAIPERGP
jgi:hypothetical protein